jgi:hypothetical protein
MNLRAVKRHGKSGGPDPGPAFTRVKTLRRRLSMRHIISLSTIPPRFDAIGPTLQGLIAQTSRPEAIELYIPNSYRRFPQWGGALPSVPDGVTIVRTDEDLGPATKILPAARAYRGQTVELLYVDDDILFTRDWAQTSLSLRKAHPRTAICSASFPVRSKGFNWTADGPLPRTVAAPCSDRQPGFVFRRFLKRVLGIGRDGTRKTLFAHKLKSSGYSDVAEGFGGVMVQPDFFDDLVYDIPQVLWLVDDVWLSGHLARRGIPIWAERSLNLGTVLLDTSDTFPLHRLVADGADRIAANVACIQHMRATYGVWGGEMVKAG